MDYEKIVKQEFAIYEDNFYDLFLNLERKSVKTQNKDAWTYRYDFPRKNAHFLVEFDEQKRLSLYLSINGHVYQLGRENSAGELWDKAEEFKQIMKDNHLSFCPRHTPEFVEELKKDTKGTVISFNGGRVVSCIDKKEDMLVFKSCFNGNLKDISIAGVYVNN